MQQYKKPTSKEIKFLEESNFIEQEYSKEALKDSIKAWQYAIKNIDNIDVNYVLEIHYILMRHLNERIAGNYRNCDVWIGGQCKSFLSKYHINCDIEAWLSDFQQTCTTKHLSNDAQLIAKNSHIHFEYIHPFADGNGRVGRILYNIHRLKMNLAIHIIYTGKEQMKYYKWFN